MKREKNRNNGDCDKKSINPIHKSFSSVTFKKLRYLLSFSLISSSILEWEKKHIIFPWPFSYYRHTKSNTERKLKKTKSRLDLS